MFSATLSPMSFYADMLGVAGDEGGSMIQLPSPFPQENLLIIRASIPTRYSQRALSAGAIAHMIAAITNSKAGNYLICFPSYTYLKQIIDAFLQISGSARVIIQRPHMSIMERSAFIGEFTLNPSASMAAFVVMGGVFSEGIDMVGERLSGAVIVGVGLPQICLENQTLSEVFQDRFDQGFQYAYVYPGIARVLQAAGRVIRSETDRGIVLLIDDRWNEREYRSLLPRHWRVRQAANAAMLADSARMFWENGGI
jgi:DNA excision repair protein ERCC-2